VNREEVMVLFEVRKVLFGLLKFPCWTILWDCGRAEVNQD